MIWIAITLIGIIGLLIVFGVVYIRKRKMETNYYTLFTMGVIWLPLGLVFMGSENGLFNIFFILGLVYLIAGLANRDKWPEDKKFWLRRRNGKNKSKRA